MCLCGKKHTNNKMKKPYSVSVFLMICITIFFISCGSNSTQKKFFDIPGYFKTEIDSLKKSNYIVSKTAVYNGDTSRQEIKASEMNWEKEFAIFLEADINKPAYYANMKQSKGVANDTDFHSDIYTNSSLKNSIQLVEVGFQELGKQVDRATYVRVKLEKSNLVSETSIEALYSKDYKYWVKGKQKIKNLGDENNFFVEGQFHK